MKPRGKDILLVEDDPREVDLAMLEFEAHGFHERVLVLCNGVDAIEFLFGERVGCLPQIILLHWNLPKFGQAVMRRLKGNPRTREITTFVLLASVHDIGLLSKGKSRPDGYLLKPFYWGDFVRQLGPSGVRRLQQDQGPPHPTAA